MQEQNAFLTADQVAADGAFAGDLAVPSTVLGGVDTPPPMPVPEPVPPPMPVPDPVFPAPVDSVTPVPVDPGLPVPAPVPVPAPTPDPAPVPPPSSSLPVPAPGAGAPPAQVPPAPDPGQSTGTPAQDTGAPGPDVEKPDPASGGTAPGDGTTDPGSGDPADGDLGHTDQPGTFIGTPDGTSGTPAGQPAPQSKGYWDVDPSRLDGFGVAVTVARLGLAAVQTRVERMQGEDYTPQLGTSPVGQQLARKFDDRLNGDTGLRGLLAEAMRRMDRFIESAEKVRDAYRDAEDTAENTIVQAEQKANG